MEGLTRAAGVRTACSGAVRLSMVTSGGGPPPVARQGTATNRKGHHDQLQDIATNPSHPQQGVDDPAEPRCLAWRRLPHPHRDPQLLRSQCHPQGPFRGGGAGEPGRRDRGTPPPRPYQRDLPLPLCLRGGGQGLRRHLRDLRLQCRALSQGGRLGEGGLRQCRAVPFRPPGGAAEPGRFRLQHHPRADGDPAGRADRLHPPPDADPPPVRAAETSA